MIRAGLALLALAWGSGAVAAQPVRVFAASSLTEVLQEAGRVYTARTKVPVTFSFASSGTIARQLEAGAGADLFVSADEESMDYAAARRAIVPATRQTVTGNRLALIAPAGTRTTLAIRRGLPITAALGAAGRLAVGDPAYVPAGRYAEQALTWAGVWPSVRQHLAKAENVRAALAYVSRGEAPLGIVYATDARLDRGVRVVELFPPASHRPIVYPMALTPRARSAAAGFARFLASRPGQALFARYGFSAPR